MSIARVMFVATLIGGFLTLNSFSLYSNASSEDDDLASFPQKLNSDLSSAAINLDREFVSAREERFGMMSLGLSIVMLSILQYMDQLGLDDERKCAVHTIQVFSCVFFVNGLFWYIWGLLSGLKKVNPLFKGSQFLDRNNLRGASANSLVVS